MPDHRRLAILIRLRKAARVTLAQMARACGLPGSRAYESAGAWERGESVPRPSVRDAFLGYLAHTLDLAADRATLLALEPQTRLVTRAWEEEVASLLIFDNC